MWIRAHTEKWTVKTYHSVIHCGAIICVTLLEWRTRTLILYITFSSYFYNLYISSSALYFSLPGCFWTLYKRNHTVLFFYIWLFLVNIICVKYTYLVYKNVLIFSLLFRVQYDFTIVHLSIYPFCSSTFELFLVWGYAFFQSAYGTFSKINYMLHHNTSLNKFKRTKIIQSISLTTKEWN